MKRWYLLPICIALLVLALPAQADTPLGYVPYSSSYDILRINSASDSNFSALINSTPSGTSVAYDTVVGNENSIVPAAATQIGKLVLRNTTRGTSAKISTVNMSTNTITVTSADDISGWADNDVITVNSATCVTASAPYYFDLDLSGFLPSTAAAVVLQWSFKDSGTAGSAVAILHPYEAYADMKTKAIRTQLANAWMQSGADAVIPVISQKVCVNWDASGSATASVYLRISGWFETSEATATPGSTPMPTLSPYIITGTLSPGSPYQVERSFTYGQISVVILVGAILALSLLIVVWKVIRGH